MGKAAVAAAGAVVSGLAAFAGLAGWLPVAWAEGAALVLTGGTLLGASFLLEEKKPAQVAAQLPVQPVASQRVEA